MSKTTKIKRAIRIFHDRGEIQLGSPFHKDLTRIVEVAEAILETNVIHEMIGLMSGTNRTHHILMILAVKFPERNIWL